MSKNSFFNLWVFTFLLCGFSSCQQKETVNFTPTYSIIPLPAQMEKMDGFFQINDRTKIVVQSREDLLMPLVGYLNERFRKLYNMELETSKTLSGNTIHLQLTESDLGTEGYKLEVTTEGITVSAKETAGIFYGIQSMLQLMPDDQPVVSNVNITDQPRYSYRGMHLDVSRHFFPSDFIKKYIDFLAKYKYNSFHWHLTDDQGWRVEIKKYPKLQEVAAYRPETLIGHYSEKPQQFDGQRYGGYYTQEEIKDIVAYAASRHITVIPEIEMPGHARAAIAAYPELSCTGDTIEPATKWGVFEEVFCPTEETFTFLENVLTEVLEMFPSQYIHIGGDECPKTAWKNSAFCQELIKKEGLRDEHELQSYFIQRIEKFLNSKGRKIIGWDEILEGGSHPTQR